MLDRIQLPQAKGGEISRVLGRLLRRLCRLSFSVSAQPAGLGHIALEALLNDNYDLKLYSGADGEPVQLDK